MLKSHCGGISFVLTAAQDGADEQPGQHRRGVKLQLGHVAETTRPAVVPDI